jgi:hypothetical protein
MLMRIEVIWASRIMQSFIKRLLAQTAELAVCLPADWQRAGSKFSSFPGRSPVTEKPMRADAQE